jgi:hypothetical protein
MLFRKIILRKILKFISYNSGFRKKNKSIYSFGFQFIVGAQTNKRLEIFSQKFLETVFREKS